METNARIKDEVIEWMGIQEKAMLHCNKTILIDDKRVVIECLGYTNGDRRLHLHDLRPLLLALGIDEDEVTCTEFESRVDDVMPDYVLRYRYSIMIGDIEYFSLATEKWGEEK